MPVSVFSKRSKNVLIIGLSGLAITAAALYLLPRNRFLMKPVLLASKYRRLSRYVIAQAKTETGDFTSRFYRDLHNMFGMKSAVKRKQLGKASTLFEADGGTAMRHYSNDIQSLRDLFLYFDYVSFPTYVESAERYVTELKNRKYFSTTYENYLALVKSHLEKRA
jgi:flagellum-specific peptidoglycan hydrolase FlgJ